MTTTSRSELDGPCQTARALDIDVTRQAKAFLLEKPSWQNGQIEARFVDVHYFQRWNKNNYPNGKGNHPVTDVNWYAAMAYAEWKRAAHGGLVGKKYLNGNTITPRDATTVLMWVGPRQWGDIHRTGTDCVFTPFEKDHNITNYL